MKIQNQKIHNNLILKIILTLSLSLVVLLISSDIIGFYLTKKSHQELEDFYNHTMIPSFKLQVVDQSISILFTELGKVVDENKINNIQSQISKLTESVEKSKSETADKYIVVNDQIKKISTISELKIKNNKELTSLVKSWEKLKNHILMRIKSNKLDSEDLDQYFIAFKNFRGKLQAVNNGLLVKARSRIDSSKIITIKTQLIILVLLCIGLIVGFLLSKVSFKKVKVLLRSIENSHKEQNKLALIVRHSKDAIISINEQMEIESWNLGAIELFNFTESNIIGKKISNFFTKDELLKLVKMIKSNSEQSSEFVMFNKTKKILNVLITITRIKEGKITIFSLIIKDITQNKKLEEKLEKQKAITYAAAKLASVGEVSGGVAHEINNPLMIVVNANNKVLKFLESNNFVDDKIYQLSLKAKSHIKRIASIVKSLQTFSSSTADGIKKQSRLEDIIQDVLQLSYENMLNEDIDFNLSEYNKDIKVNCRSRDITEVILNLLSNSRYAIKSLATKWIKLDISEDENILKIVLTDSGNGIDSNTVQKMMQPFFTTKDVGQGTGVGLSVAKGIIDSHDGEFYYDSSCENTRFIIKLPMS